MQPLATAVSVKAREDWQEPAPGGADSCEGTEGIARRIARIVRLHPPITMHRFSDYVPMIKGEAQPRVYYLHSPTTMPAFHIVLVAIQTSIRSHYSTMTQASPHMSNSHLHPHRIPRGIPSYELSNYSMPTTRPRLHRGHRNAPSAVIAFHSLRFVVDHPAPWSS